MEGLKTWLVQDFALPQCAWPIASHGCSRGLGVCNCGQRFEGQCMCWSYCQCTCIWILQRWSHPELYPGTDADSRLRGSPFGYDVVGFKVFKVPRDAHEEGNGSAPHGGIKPDDSQADSQDQNDANHSQVQEDEPPPVNSSEVQEDEPPRVKRTKLDAKWPVATCQVTSANNIKCDSLDTSCGYHKVCHSNFVSQTKTNLPGQKAAFVPLQFCVSVLVEFLVSLKLLKLLQRR